MTSTRKPTGFLDLPLELRQAIYTHVLPSDKAFRLPLRSTNAPEATTLAVCAAHPVLKEEMKHWLYKQCDGVLRFTPDRKTDLPSDIEWHRFRSIDIQIDFMTRSDALPENYVGLQQAIASVTYGQPVRLPDTWIYFLEDNKRCRDGPRSPEGGDASVYPDWHDASDKYAYANWFEEMLPGESHRWPKEMFPSGCMCGDCRDKESDSDGDSDGGLQYEEDGRLETVTCLQTIESPSDLKAPIAVLVLEAFLQLPPCKSIHLWGLMELQSDIWAGFRKVVFDDGYWLNICSALKCWLGGKREGITLPQGRDRFGRPVLEQLAYMRVGECTAYCDEAGSGECTTICDCSPY